MLKSRDVSLGLSQNDLRAPLPWSLRRQLPHLRAIPPVQAKMVFERSTGDVIFLVSRPSRTAAAVKMQATYRGRAARKEQQQQKEESEAEAKAKAAQSLELEGAALATQIEVVDMSLIKKNQLVKGPRPVGCRGCCL